jgi:UDP-N-acetyl-D-mannosaminuronate dehydrogenase
MTTPTATARPAAPAAERLRELIKTDRATVGVIGLGYVGLPLAAALHGGGLPVLGFDIDQRKIDCIARKENYLKHLGDDMDFFVAFSPEREDPGRKTHTTRSTPKLVGGVDPLSTELAAMLYEKGVETVVRVSSAEVAEAAKLLENIFRAVNIAMVNEMKIVLTAMGIDVWEVIRAAKTKPFGFMPFYPGPGLGGHCIPIDPFYLTWKARESAARRASSSSRARSTRRCRTTWWTSSPTRSTSAASPSRGPTSLSSDSRTSPMWMTRARARRSS